MIVYRFYVGHNDRDGKPLFDRVRVAIKAAMQSYFPEYGYTLYGANGYWKGNAEPCTVAELLAETSLAPVAKLAAEHLAAVLNQSCVLLTRCGARAEFIESNQEIQVMSEWEPAGALRSHPIDAPEQCFDAEKHGSPYFYLMVRADIGDGRGIEVAAWQGTATGEPGSRTILPVQRLLGSLSSLGNLFRAEILRYQEHLEKRKR